MATVYGRIAKISNVVGRSNYLNDEKRQEKIVLQKIEMQYSWQEHLRHFARVKISLNTESNSCYIFFVKKGGKNVLLIYAPLLFLG